MAMALEVAHDVETNALLQPRASSEGCQARRWKIAVFVAAGVALTLATAGVRTLVARGVSSHDVSRPRARQMSDQKCHVVLNDAVPADARAGSEFVCDTCGWYHGDGGSDFPASAGSGGCHSYLFLKGTAPCTSYGPCDGCVSPAAEVVHTFKMNNTCDRDCSGETVPCQHLR